MIRKIKFRARNTEDGCWCFWTMPDGKNPSIDALATEMFFELTDPDTRGESTGLRDRHGKDIYEGDIVNDWTGRLLICQWGGFGSFEWQDYNAWEAGYYDAYLKTEDIAALNKETTLEVIGNIYENPELVKGN